MRFSLFLALAATGTPAVAQIYKCGSTYSQVRCAPDAKEVQAERPPSRARAPGPESPLLEASRTAMEASRVRAEAEARRLDEEGEQRKARVAAAVQSGRQRLESARQRPAPDAATVSRNLGLCEKTIRDAMKDPEAARISAGRREGPALQFGQPELLPVAIEYYFKVNGKNSYGGYTGNKLYVCTFDLTETRLIAMREVGPYPANSAD